MATKLSWLVAAALLLAAAPLNESAEVLAHKGSEQDVNAEEIMREYAGGKTPKDDADDAPKANAEDADEVNPDTFSKPPTPIQVAVKTSDSDDILASNIEIVTGKVVPSAPAAVVKAAVETASKTSDETPTGPTDDEDDDSVGVVPQDPEETPQEQSAEDPRQNTNDMAADEVEEMEEKVQAPSAPKAKADMPADEAEEIQEEQEAALKKSHIMALASPSSEVKVATPEKKVVAAPAVVAPASFEEADRIMKQALANAAVKEQPHTAAAVLPPPPPMPVQGVMGTTEDPLEIVPSVQGSVSSATSDMENEVSKLVMGASKAGAAFFATPMGGSIKTIQKLIEDKMMVKVLDTHKLNQRELDRLIGQVHHCFKAKDTAFGGVNRQLKKYKKFSPMHKACRNLEAVKFTASTGCHEELGDKKKIKNLKCAEFAEIANKVGDVNANRAIVTKGGSESVDSYVRRITATVCGGKGGKGGMLDKFLFHKEKCNKATREYVAMQKVCKKQRRMYVDKKTECNNIQDQMDLAACQRTVLVKDACESYAECYTTKLEAYNLAKRAAQKEEADRKAEWRALKRMQCFIGVFSDGKVQDSEVAACRKKTHDTNHLIINYPKVPKLHICSVPDLYPTTPAYKRAEFSPLPTLAKGKEDANECVGVLEISTKPRAGPKSCKCERVTLNGPYSAGPMVRCQNCIDIRRSQDKNSCPEGTKLFSPRSAKDWKTFIASASPLRNPHWIVDVTRPKNGCGGCTSAPMNSRNKKQGSGKYAWRTADGSPWWLRSTRYSEPNGDYHANCYLDLWHTPKSEKSITFNDGSCGYHSKSYYCQPIIVSTRPAKGSPSSCKCKRVALTGKYGAGVLIRCMSCIDVRKKGQLNSCPKGTKLFSPRSRGDWKTVINSVKPVRSPHWIVDVTRPQNGCGGCTKHNMNSRTPSQATWRTSDGSAWWLRSNKYSEPNGDYKANCYLDLWHTPANEDSVTFNDGSCNYHSNSYFCQPKKKKTVKKSRR